MAVRSFQRNSPARPIVRNFRAHALLGWPPGAKPTTGFHSERVLPAIVFWKIVSHENGSTNTSLRCIPWTKDPIVWALTGVRVWKPFKSRRDEPKPQRHNRNIPLENYALHGADDVLKNPSGAYLYHSRSTKLPWHPACNPPDLPLNGWSRGLNSQDPIRKGFTNERNVTTVAAGSCSPSPAAGALRYAVASE